MTAAKPQGWPSKRSMGTLTRFCAAVAALVSVVSGSAVSGDWSIESRLEEKIDFDDNIDLDVDPKGWVVGSISSLNVNVIRKSDTYRFDLLGDLIYQDYEGPGESSDLDRFTPRLETKLKKSDKLTTYDFSAYYRRDRASTFDLIDTATIAEDAIRETFYASTSVDRKIDQRNSVVWSGYVQDIRFSPEGDGVVPSFRTDTSLLWRRALTRRTDGKLSAGLGWNSLKDDDDTKQLIYRTKAEIESRLTKLFTGRVGVGVYAADSRTSNESDSDGGGGLGFGVGPLFDFALDYKLKVTTLSLTGSYSIRPNESSGDLEDRLTIGFDLQHQINSANSVGLWATYQTASAATTDDGQQDTRYFSISPFYSYTLDRDWTLRTGYEFSAREDDDGTAQSNSAYVSVSREFVVMP